MGRTITKRSVSIISLLPSSLRLSTSLLFTWPRPLFLSGPLFDLLRYRLMEQGSNQRATSSTRLNELSSRSHAVFMLIAEQSEIVVSEESEGKLKEKIG